MFGLDVLGNPFSLIRGLTEGVESLFYEPFSGSVRGPGEFFDSVGTGIKQLVGTAIIGGNNEY
jgi:vacuolar protein sorting-associated protein 13A/C